MGITYRNESLNDNALLAMRKLKVLFYLYSLTRKMYNGSIYVNAR